MTREEYEKIVGGVDIERLFHNVFEFLLSDGIQQRVPDLAKQTIRSVEDIRGIIYHLQEIGEKAEGWRDAEKDPPTWEGPYYCFVKGRGVLSLKWDDVTRMFFDSDSEGCPYFYKVDKWREIEYPLPPKEESRD